jgi:hypothetical protein
MLIYEEKFKVSCYRYYLTLKKFVNGFAVENHNVQNNVNLVHVVDYNILIVYNSTEKGWGNDQEVLKREG